MKAIGNGRGTRAFLAQTSRYNASAAPELHQAGVDAGKACTALVAAGKCAAVSGTLLNDALKRRIAHIIKYRCACAFGWSC
eukprot:COSAG01_NODE_11281_length_1966_cov_8.566149_3_plen_81_part_00